MKSDSIARNHIHIYDSHEIKHIRNRFRTIRQTVVYDKHPPINHRVCKQRAAFVLETPYFAYDPGEKISRYMCIQCNIIILYGKIMLKVSWGTLGQRCVIISID